jgi:WD40 repeat protein
MSHRANDAYMRDWDTAYEELRAGRGPASGVAGGGAGSGSGSGALARQGQGAPGPRSGSAGSTGSAGSAGKGPYLAYGKGGGSSAHRPGGAGAGPADSGVSSIRVLSDGGGAAGPGIALPSTPAFAITPQWRRGPLDPAGRLVDLSDRPTMCVAIDPIHMEAVCGSSDHAVYGVSLVRGDKSRVLYGGKYGHSEWVTGVCYLGDGSGRVVSSGMDGKACVWAAKKAGKQFSCSDLIGHFGSVTTVASPGGGTAACGPQSSRWGGHVVSAGYDKTIKLWDAANGGCIFSAKSHGAPILSLSLQAGRGGELWAASGDRDGVAAVWRMHDGELEGMLRGHRGHLTSCAWLPADAARGSGAGGEGDDDGGGASAGGSVGGSDLVITGAQDGHVRIWDVRSKACVANIPAHASSGGSGAVGDIAVARVAPGESAVSGAIGSETVVVTAGADKRICILDPRAGFEVRSVLTDHRDFIYSMTVAGSLCFSGGGDGLLFVHDLSSAKPLWAVGAGMAAIRGIGVAGRHLFASGDDGKAIVYDF